MLTLVLLFNEVATGACCVGATVEPVFVLWLENRGGNSR